MGLVRKKLPDDFVFDEDDDGLADVNIPNFTVPDFVTPTGRRVTERDYRPPPVAPVDIVQACRDPNLFGPWFKDAAEWQAWFAFLRAFFALPMPPDHRKIYRACTERERVPRRQFSEAWLVVGRRGGKSRVLALIAVYLATFFDWLPYLSPGERAHVVCVAPDRRQARTIFRYIEAFLTRVPMLRRRIIRATAELIELEGQVVIEVQTASFRTIRGYTVVAALMDEIAFLRSDESSNPDYEIIEALRPGMATIPGSVLLCASSPHARRGQLWEMYKDYFGTANSDYLLWQAPTWVMNPTLPARIYKRAYKKDPASAGAEYGAQFRTDVESFVSQEAIESVEVKGRYELPYDSRYEYTAFVDPSGGSKDSMTLAIAHRDDDNRAVLDLLREEVPPFSPEGVVRDFCRDIKRYGVGRVYGDRYGGEWPAEQFRKHDINYDISLYTKSELYKEALPMINAGECELLDNDKCRTQLVSLERRSHRGGRDTVDKPPKTHDDVANAAAGALVHARQFAALDMW